MDRLTQLLYRWLLPRPGAWSPTYTGASFDAYLAFVRVFGPAAVTFVLAAIVAADFDLPVGWFAAAFAVSVGAFAVSLRAVAIYARSWDEMQRSLLLNAAALAFCLTVGAIFLNGELEARGLAHFTPERVGMFAIVCLIASLGTMRYLLNRGMDE